MSNLIYSDDSVFNQENAQTIVNTINCVGVMGAGIALEYKLRFPEMYEDYVKKCRKHEVTIGKPYLYKEKTKWILNFPTKKHWKDGSKLEWIELGLKYFKDNYKKWGVTSIAFPKLGTEHGGLNWEEVKKIMEFYLENIDIPVFICLDKFEYPKGLEKDMTSYLNQLDEDYLLKIGVAKHIVPKITKNLPVKRFRFLREIDGIGRISYEKIYSDLYNQIINKNQFFPEIQTKKLNESKEIWSISEISHTQIYSENIRKSPSLINKNTDDFSKELINQFKREISSLLKLRNEVKIIEEKLTDCSLKLVKNYLFQKYPDINWNSASIKGQDIEGKLKNKPIVIGKVIIDVVTKKNDFDAKQKKAIKSILKKLERSTVPYKYLFVANESAYNILQTKYKREYPQVEFINILNTELKSCQQKLLLSDYENSTTAASSATPP